MYNIDKVVGFKKSEILKIIQEFDKNFTFEIDSKELSLDNLSNENIPIKKYFNISETINYISINSEILIDFENLIDLCKEDKLTPVFLFSGYVGDEMLDGYSKMKGYFTAKDFMFHLTNAQKYYPVNSHVICHDYVEIPYHYNIYEIISKDSDRYNRFDDVFLFTSLPLNETNQLTKIDLDEVRFNKVEIDKLIGINETDNSELVQQQQATIDHLTAENQKQADTIRQLNERLEQQASEPSQSDTPADNDLFAKILDESNENHAIDLKYAINLWLDLYVINPRAHGEHSGNADTWLKKNTEYSELKGGDGSIKRIREIATPLKKFGSTRPKENQK